MKKNIHNYLNKKRFKKNKRRKHRLDFSGKHNYNSERHLAHAMILFKKGCKLPSQIFKKVCQAVK